MAVTLTHNGTRLARRCGELLQILTNKPKL